MIDGVLYLSRRELTENWKRSRKVQYCNKDADRAHDVPLTDIVASCAINILIMKFEKLFEFNY